MMEQTPPSNAALAAFETDAMVSHGVALRESSQSIDTPLGADQVAITIDHVADHNRRYPGEVVSFYTCVRIHAPTPGFTVRIQIPAGLEIDTYRAVARDILPIFYPVSELAARELVMLPGSDGEPFPLRVPDQPTRAIEITRPAQEMVWRVAEAQEPGSTYEFVVTTLVLPMLQDTMLHSTATLLMSSEEGDQAIRSTTASVGVFCSGRYLEYLPSLYERDAFMARFLMLFESFLAPIEQQISEMHNYFDPDLTPARFLPWLATWFNLMLDDNWSEAQQRELLNSIMWLYRRRGTRVAMQRYLEIFTGQPVEILERRAKNMALGKMARLGVGVALGTSNMPHTFSVKLRLRPIVAADVLEEEAAAREVARLEKQRLALISRMIMAEKPAHTSYKLEILPVPE